MKEAVIDKLVEDLGPKLRKVFKKSKRRVYLDVEAEDLLDVAKYILDIDGVRYAIATGRARRNPVPDLQGALKPLIVNHHPAVTDPAKIGVLLRAAYGYTGHFPTQCALNGYAQAWRGTEG